MTFKIYKTHRLGEGYTYWELLSLVIAEWKDTFPFTESRNVIRNYLIKEGIVDRTITKERRIRYVPRVTRAITRPTNLGTDVSTGYNIFALPEEKKFAVIDEDWSVRPEPRTRYVRITVTTTFSLDTAGARSHQRLKFYEATAFTTVTYTEDVTPIAEDLRDFIRESLSHWFNPGVAEASEIKIGVEIMSSPPEEALGDKVVYIEYGHGGTKAEGYATLKKTETQMRTEKAQGFEPHAGFGRPKGQKKLEV